MYPSFDGKRAVVLDGSRGKGRAITLRLTAEGTHILLSYARSTESAMATADACWCLGVEVNVMRADVGDAEALAARFEFVECCGGVDIVVNKPARGLERPRSAIEERPRHLRYRMDVDPVGPWRASQATVPLIERRGGALIVNLLSPGIFN